MAGPAQFVLVISTHRLQFLLINPHSTPNRITEKKKTAGTHIKLKVIVMPPAWLSRRSNSVKPDKNETKYWLQPTL